MYTYLNRFVHGEYMNYLEKYAMFQAYTILFLTEYPEITRFFLKNFIYRSRRTEAYRSRVTLIQINSLPEGCNIKNYNILILNTKTRCFALRLILNNMATIVETNDDHFYSNVLPKSKLFVACNKWLIILFVKVKNLNVH